MAYEDPTKTLIALLNAIVIPPESLPSITKVVKAGWIDQEDRLGPGGEITPAYTVSKPIANPTPLDSNGETENVSYLIDVNVWCQSYGPTENAINLQEKMLAQLRAAIKASRQAPSDSIYFMSISKELARNEAGPPPIQRTIVTIKAGGFR